MSPDVILNNYGFYELKNKPNEQELQQYYEKKYYQEEKGAYSKSYTPEEKKFIINHIKIIKEALSRFTSLKNGHLIDIGCGEGFCLKEFHRIGWKVSGIDFSQSGIEAHNPDMLRFLSQGNIFNELESHINLDVKANIIWLDNVLEHALDPLILLKKCRALAFPDTYLVVEVPNDFSILQTSLLNQGVLKEPNWVFAPDHISYFNPDGLMHLASESGWAPKFVMSDFPIDIFLYNQHSNYYKDRNKGREAHLARIAIENSLFEKSPSDLVDMYASMAKIGIGRQIIALFKLNSPK